MELTRNDYQTMDRIKKGDDEMKKLNLETIRLNANKTREETAKLIGVSSDRYNRIATGTSKLLATEFIAIHNVFNIPYENIAINN